MRNIKSRSYEDIRSGAYQFEILKYAPIYLGMSLAVYLFNATDYVLDGRYSPFSLGPLGALFVSSIAFTILSISIAALYLIIKYKNNNKVFWSVIAFSSISIGVTIVDTMFRVDEFTFIKSNTIEHQEFNLFSQEKNDNVGMINEVVELLTIDNFDSGKYSLPDYDWDNLERKIKNSGAKVIILSGFSDPHKIRDDSDFSNGGLAYERALSVREKVKSMPFVKHNKLPVFVMSNGIDYGVKLFDYQISEYFTERKVKVYVGT